MVNPFEYLDGMDPVAVPLAALAAFDVGVLHAAARAAGEKCR
ncbi:unannotated protein [freshwater metagenome]|jgi:hypothetical protein|uniref:Unannotated protein n=1 Tax=freshwater metagenome TaxID=449393 RepID=A0A6J7MXU0_9ZZZZ